MTQQNRNPQPQTQQGQGQSQPRRPDPMSQPGKQDQHGQKDQKGYGPDLPDDDKQRAQNDRREGQPGQVQDPSRQDRTQKG